MIQKYSSMMIIGILLMGVVISCSSTTNPIMDDGEEESDTELALDQAYDKIRSGVRVILTYDVSRKTFNGTIENTTDEPLKNVRVEVHLSNGIELGPTKATDLAPREKVLIKLTTTSTDFDGWTVHPEVGSTEHSNNE
ncbi:hypothetical protein JT359_19980 [Candidatus Poribacteria bacterium]|nr:hypothetical protein [Candidatus Poribacteria bacterium]